MNTIDNGVLEEFRVEFWHAWGRLPNKAFFLALFVAWVALFHFLGNSTLGYVDTKSLFGYMYDSYTAGDTGLSESQDAFGLLIPVIVLALFWVKRNELLDRDLNIWTPALALVMAGLALHILAFLVQQPRISIVGFFVGLYGLTGLTWGAGWLRTSFFPFILFGFCVPLGTLAEPLTFHLRLLVTMSVEFISHFFLAIDVIREGTMLRDPTNRYSYEVAAACSGIRSLIATLALGTILGFISFKRWWQRGLMIAATIPLAMIGNLLRMMSIVIAAEFFGPDAGTYVHDGGPAGIFSMLPYIPAFFGLLWLERFLADREAPGDKGSGEGKPREKVAPEPVTG